MKQFCRNLCLALFAALLAVLCIFGVACGKKAKADPFEFKKDPPEKVVIYTEVVMTNYFKEESDASYKLKVSYYDQTLESEQTVEQDSMVFLCENYGDHTFTLVRTKGKKTAELSCVIEVVPETPAMTAPNTLEVSVGDTKSFSDLYRASNIITTPFETEETVAFTSVKIKEETVDLVNGSTKEETQTIENGLATGSGQFTFSKQAIYEFTVSASNSEGTVEQILTVVCVDENKIPAEMTASKAFFGEGNDTVMLLKSTNIEDMAFFSYNETFNYDESNVRVEFFGNAAPQIVISADQQNGNLKAGTGYLSTLEQNLEQYQVHGPSRTSSRLTYSPLVSLSMLEDDGRYILDLSHHTFRNTTDTTVGYRVVTITLYEKDEDGNLTQLGTYNSRWNFDTNAAHENLKEGYILFVGSTRKDIVFKYYKPSAPVLGTPTLLNVGSTVSWGETKAVVGQDTANPVSHTATGYQVQFNGGEWEDNTDMSYTVDSGLAAGKYELNVRAVYTIDEQTYYGASSTALVYHNVLNVNAFRLNVIGNTVSWNPRQGYCDTSYQYMINNSGEWIDTTATSVTLKGYERAYQNVSVRGVYFDDKGDADTANDETTYTEVATAAVLYNMHEATESAGSISFSSKTRANMSYVAYEGGKLDALTNTHLKISFVGRNMPTVNFFANKVQPDTMNRSSGAYVTHDYNNIGYALFTGNTFVYDAGKNTLSLNEGDSHVMYTGITEASGKYYVYVYVFKVKGDNYTSLLAKSISDGYTAEQLSVTATDDLYTIIYGNAHYANLAFDVVLSNTAPAEVSNFDKKPVYTFDEVNRTISWTALDGVASYKVTVSQNGTVVKEETVTATTYDLSELADGYYDVTVASVFEKFYSTASTTQELLLGADPAAIELSWMGNAIVWKDRSLVDHYEVYVNGTKVADLEDGTERYTFTDKKAGESLSVSVVAIYVDGNEAEQSENVPADFVYGTVTMNKISPVAGATAETVDYIEFDGFSGATWMLLEFTGKNAPNFAFNAKNAYSTWTNQSYTTAGIFMTLSNETNWGMLKITNSLNSSTSAGVWKSVNGSATNPLGLGYYDDNTNYVMIFGFDKDGGTSAKDNVYYYLYSVSDTGALTKLTGGLIVEDISLPSAGGSKTVIYPHIKNGGSAITFNFANPTTSLNDLVLGLDETAFPYKSQLKTDLGVKDTVALSYISDSSKTMNKISPTNGVTASGVTVDYLEFDNLSGATWFMVQFTGKNVPNFAVNATQAYSAWNNEGYSNAGIFMTLSNESNWGAFRLTNSLNSSNTGGIWKGVNGTATAPLSIGHLNATTNYILILGYDKNGGSDNSLNVWFYLYSIDEYGELNQVVAQCVDENHGGMPNAGGSKAVIYPNINASGYESEATQITFNYVTPAATLAGVIENVSDTCPYKAQLKTLHSIA